MSAPLEITAVGICPVDDALESVSMRVGGRLDTVVVPRGLGEPLARLLLAGEVVAAARALVDVFAHTVAGNARVERFIPALGRLASAFDSVDAAPLGHEVVSVDVGTFAATGIRHDVQPGAAIEAAVRRLYDGESIFRAVTVAGVVLIATPEGTRPVPYGMSAVDETTPGAYRALSAQLRELAEGLDTQFVVGELGRAAAAVDDLGRERDGESEGPR